MDIIAMARDLGAAIQQDDRYIALQLATQANDNDAQLQDLMGQFGMKRMALQMELQKPDGEKDAEKVKTLNEEMQKAYSDIMSNKNMAVYNTAKKEIEDLMNRINAILMMSVNGEDPYTAEPSSCSGSCDSCGGCH
jgi:cell fate (sporulation/competence/biofilm development) regulator YlbF (YheA/YmcA/DUF963 family)